MDSASAHAPRPGPRRIIGLLGWALIGVALVLAFHPPMLGLGHEGHKLPGWDATRVFWADLVFMRRSVLAGELPLWNPYDRAGYAFAAEPQSGLYDPITWVVVVVSLPFKTAPAWLISLKALLYYALASAGVAAFLRPVDRRLSRVPQWAVAVGVLAYTVGGRMDKLKDQSGLWPSAWAPWLLVALRFALLRPDWKRGVALGGVGGLCAASGYPPVSVRLALLLLVPMGLFWLVAQLRRAHRDQNLRPYLAGLWRCALAAALVTAGLVAAQTVATAQVLPMTMRADLSLSEVLYSSVKIVHGRGLLAPGQTKVSVLLYAGMATGLGCALALARRQDRAESALLVLLGVLGFFLACGENSPVLPAVAHLPGFRSFRIAGHFVVLSSIATAIVAPRGLAALAHAEGQDRVAMKILAPALSLFGVAVFLRYAFEPSLVAKSVVVGSGLTLSTLAYLPGPKDGVRRWTTAVGSALVVLIGLDIALGNRPVAEILQPPPDEGRPAAMASAVRNPENRMADFGWARNRPGPRTGVRDLVGARPALTDRQYMRVYKAAQAHPNLLAVMGVEAAAFERRTRSAARLRPRPQAKGSDRAIRVVPNPWPRAFFSAHVERAKGPGAAARSLREGEPRVVLFGKAARNVQARASPRPALALEANFESVNRIKVHVDAPAPGFVVLNEAWDPGWRAEVDGKAAPVLRANLLHRAVWVESGSHDLVLRYRPPGLRLLSLLWLITVSLCLGLGLGALRARAMPQAADTSPRRIVGSVDQSAP